MNDYNPHCQCFNFERPHFCIFTYLKPSGQELLYDLAHIAERGNHHHHHHDNKDDDNGEDDEVVDDDDDNNNIIDDGVTCLLELTQK